MNNEIAIQYENSLAQGELVFQNAFFYVFQSKKNSQSDKVMAINSGQICRQKEIPKYFQGEEYFGISLSDHGKDQFACVATDKLIQNIGLDVEPKNRNIAEPLKRGILSLPDCKIKFSFLEYISTAWKIPLELIIWCWHEAIYKADLETEAFSPASQIKNGKMNQNYFFVQLNDISNFFILNDEWLVVVVFLEKHNIS